jgi:hypothetical protein
MVQRAGVNVDRLLDLLVRSASAELTTCYYYTILRLNLIDLEGEGSKEMSRRRLHRHPVCPGYVVPPARLVCAARRQRDSRALVGGMGEGYKPRGFATLLNQQRTI